MSDDPVRCPRCGAPIGAVGAVGAACPACLFRAGAADETLASSDLTMSAAPDQATRLSTPGTAAAAAPRSSSGHASPTGPTGLPLAIGPYRIVSLLGEGGMGVVYLAEQTEPIRRTVALKVIKLGMDTRDVVARFESGRQALALMDRPNIARVIDAGATPDGRPYFVMEHVAGVPITEYCDAHRLSTRARPRLLAQVCGAVQHAHQIARSLAAARSRDAYELAAMSWETVVSSGAKAPEYQQAVSQAERAQREAPWDAGATTTLALAQYRVGQFGAATKTATLMSEAESLIKASVTKPARR